MEHKIDFAIGGQALIEGVMMRSPSYVTAAVRKKNGSIKLKEEPFVSFIQKHRLLKIPIVRGVINLFEMMMMGMRMVNFSAEEYADDEETTDAQTPDKKENRWFSIATMFFSFVISFAIAIFMFKFIPLALAEWLRKIFPYIAAHYIVFNLIDGIIRIAIFVLYIYVLSLFKSFHRIFEYHGAEHMAVHTYEKGQELTVENVRTHPPEHPRCGTSFLLAAFIVSIIVYSLVPRNPVFWINLTQRIVVIPIIAGVAYEVLKWSAKRRNHPLVKLLVVPGILSQKITTQKPDDQQIEVAIAALKRALELERAPAD